MTPLFRFFGWQCDNSCYHICLANSIDNPMFNSVMRETEHKLAHFINIKLNTRADVSKIHLFI